MSAARRAVLLGCALALLAVPSPASALHEGAPVSPEATAVFLAYGEGVTHCRFTLRKRTTPWVPDWGSGTKYAGETHCSAPVEQTARATIAADADSPALDGGLCSGFRTACESLGHEQGDYNISPLKYRITLRAPLGQGWVGDPTSCSGVGTDNLTCEFFLNDAVVDFGALE